MVKELALIISMLFGKGLSLPKDDLDVYTITNPTPHNYVVDLKEMIQDDFGPYVNLYNWLINRSAEDTVTFSMHNYGGSILAGAIVINGIKSTKAHTITRIDGPSFSMGAFISCSTNELHINPMSFLMFHNGSSQTSGKMSDIKYQIAAIFKLEQQFAGECVSKHILTTTQTEQIASGTDIYIFAKDIK